MEDNCVMMKSTNSHLGEEAVEFDALLRGPSRRGLTSRGLGWSDVVVEHHSCEPGEYPESISDGYIWHSGLPLALVSSRPLVEFIRATRNLQDLLRLLLLALFLR
jgi:hypothetical protein